MVWTPESSVVYFRWKGFKVHGVAIIPGPPPLKSWWATLRARQLPVALQQWGHKYFLMMPDH